MSHKKIISNNDLEHKEEEIFDVIIIGSGISGLTSGYFLKKRQENNNNNNNNNDNDNSRGINFLILESSKTTIGGRCSSGYSPNHTFQYSKGAEYIGYPTGFLKQMVNDLKIEIKSIPYPMDGIYRREEEKEGKCEGKMFLGKREIVKYLIENSSLDEYKRYIKMLVDGFKDYKEIPDIKYNEEVEYLDNISAYEWLKENNVAEVYIEKYNVTSRGLFGASLKEISALCFIPEAIFDFNEVDVNIQKIDDIKSKKNENTNAYSFKRGLSYLTNKLVKYLNEHIVLNSRVVKVEKDELTGICKLTVLRSCGKSVVLKAKNVIVSTPAPISKKICDTVLSKEKMDILSTIRYSCCTKVALFSTEPIFNLAFDLALPDDIIITDIYDSDWVERYYNQEMDNVKEYITSIYLAPKSSTDKYLVKVSDDELMSEIYKIIRGIFQKDVKKLVNGFNIQRFGYAYPVMTKGAYKRLLRLNEINTGNVLLNGDYLIYPTLEAAVESAGMAVKKVFSNLCKDCLKSKLLHREGDKNFSGRAYSLVNIQVDGIKC